MMMIPFTLCMVIFDGIDNICFKCHNLDLYGTNFAINHV